MQLLPWTTLSLVITGDDLASSTVSGGWRGAWARQGAVLHSFLTMPPEDARRALGEIAPNTRVVVTCPSAWVGLRPAAIEVRQWGGARESIEKSIESFFPLSADDAMVGVVGRVGGQGVPAGAYLLAASRHRLKPWLDAIERATGRAVDAVLSPQMGMLGLGLQAHAASRVVEHGPGGATSVHRMAHGEFEELSGSVEDESGDLHSVAWLNGDDDRTELPGAKRVGVAEQAVAAALAERVVRGRFAPLSGRLPLATPRWVPPAAMVLLAIALLWGAGQIRDGRYARGIDSLERDSVARAGLLEEVRRSRDESLRLTRLLASAEAKRGPVRGDLLADLVPALSVIPREGVLYGVQIDRTSVTIRGEARRASDVLQRLEETSEFHAAKQLDTAVPVEERKTEQFHIRAERASDAAAKPVDAPPREPAG